MEKKDIVQGIQCPRCSEKLWSKWGHDFHYCGCGYCFVDGGRNYLRYGWGIAPEGGNTQETTREAWEVAKAATEKIGKPEMIDIDVAQWEKEKVTADLIKKKAATQAKRRATIARKRMEAL